MKDSPFKGRKLVLNLDLLLYFLGTDPEFLVGFYEIRHGAAGMKNGCMILVTALHAYVCK
jgi:hypothetical protein